MEAITIKLGDKEYSCKYGMKSMLIYENICNKSFEPKTIQDVLVFFYSCILSQNMPLDMTFSDFLEIIDENPQAMTDFSEYINRILTQNALQSPRTKEKKTDKSARKN